MLVFNLTLNREFATIDNQKPTKTHVTHGTQLNQIENILFRKKIMHRRHIQSAK